MANPNVSNIAAYIKGLCSVGGRLVAAGTGDATEVTGIGADRQGFGSALVVLAAHANNTAAKKLTVTSCKISDSADNNTFGSDTELLSATTDIVTGTGDNYGQITIPVNLSLYKRYVRLKMTPDHTASGTDTAEFTASFVLGGAVAKPTT